MNFLQKFPVDTSEVKIFIFKEIPNPKKAPVKKRMEMDFRESIWAMKKNLTVLHENLEIGYLPSGANVAARLVNPHDATLTL